MPYPWFLAAAYLAGVAWCLIVSDARPGERIVLAILWPLGPIAFVVTVAILLVAAAIAFPVVGVPVLVAVVLAVWWAFF